MIVETKDYVKQLITVLNLFLNDRFEIKYLKVLLVELVEVLQKVEAEKRNKVE